MVFITQSLPKKLGSHKKIKFKCDKCNKIFDREYRYCLRIRNKYKKDLCKKCCTVINNSRPEYRENMSKVLKKMHKDNPEIAQKISKATKGKINLGDKNGMKQPEARKKVSETRKKMLKDPKLREKISKQVKKAWADGKFDGVATGRCKWYDYTKRDGTIIKCQGTWELAFVEWADNNNLEFTTHRGRISYIDEHGDERNYYPDFFVKDWDQYVDIKCDYYWELQKEKLKHIFSSNPNLNIKILKKEDLIKLGVEL